MPRQEPGRRIVSVSLREDVYWQLKHQQVNMSRLFNELLDNYMAGFDGSRVHTKARIRVLEGDIRELKTQEVMKLQELASLKRHAGDLEKQAVTKQQTLDDLFRALPTPEDFRAQTVPIKEFWLSALQVRSEEEVIEFYVKRTKIVTPATIEAPGVVKKALDG